MCIQSFIIRSFCQYVANDSFGNAYYLSYKKNHFGERRRLVIYANHKNFDSSSIPSVWHAWLHYMIPTAPTAEESTKKYDWEVEHAPNKTYSQKMEESVLYHDSHGKHVVNSAMYTSRYNAWNPQVEVCVPSIDH